jgi:hypothetical protein
MPIQSPSGLVGWPTPTPPHWLNRAAPVALFDSMEFFRPLQPPTVDSPTITIGMRPARMTKNCSTSL